MPPRSKPKTRRTPTMSAAEAIALRVFFCTAGRKIILLGGYDKARDPSDRRQRRVIARARKLLTAYRQSERRPGKGHQPQGRP